MPGAACIASTYLQSKNRHFIAVMFSHDEQKSVPKKGDKAKELIGIYGATRGAYGWAGWVCAHSLNGSGDKHITSPYDNISFCYFLLCVGAEHLEPTGRSLSLSDPPQIGE